ncbi:MAG TPA: DUF1028 domain-containing protein, partial [Candidatus Nanoarchaeia archaeon]|nr:DUF1028 domain-containing protein [Candidatus Nanoarchaeia archaeon]
MTFSIIGIDKKRGEIGIATTTKALACGAIVPDAKANIGAIATQSYPNVSYKEKALALLKKRKEPKKIIESLVKKDNKKSKRQVIIMDSKGNSAGFTGKNNIGFANHFSSKNFICAGNMLSGEEVLKAVSESFSKSKGRLQDKLIKGLLAG